MQLLSSSNRVFTSMRILWPLGTAAVSVPLKSLLLGGLDDNYVGRVGLASDSSRRSLSTSSKETSSRLRMRSPICVSIQRQLPGGQLLDYYYYYNYYCYCCYYYYYYYYY